jgi:hypothetical protein
MHRRRFLQCSALAGFGAATAGHVFAAPGDAAPPVDHTADWAWLVGSWDVRHKRLRERLAGSDDWETFGGRSAFWMTLGGLGNVDDNIVALPAGTYRGISLRAYDAASDTWAIWWLDGRDPTRIDPPVRGRFEGDQGTFVGHDTLRDKPIVMRFIWRAIHAPVPWWEQAFSADEGRSWEVNWRNWFTRTAATPTSLPTLPDAPRDWDFLLGQWRVQHRRRRDPFGGEDWESFEGGLHSWPLLGGHGHIADLSMSGDHARDAAVRVHTFDPKTRQWLAWRLDLRDPARIDAPERGRFDGDTVTFLGEMQHQGRTVRTRTAWSSIGPHGARRELALSADGGAHWSPWWTSVLSRSG